MKKKTCLRLISIFMVMCIFALCFVGCKDKTSVDDNNNDNNATVIDESKAISIAKNSKKVQDRIAEENHLIYYSTPNWGTCTAEKDHPSYRVYGDWTVILKGTISGYTDEYKSDYEFNQKFKATVIISESGQIQAIFVDRF